MLSNTNVKIAGYSLLPIADLFTGIRRKVFDHAAEELMLRVTRAEAVERLSRVTLDRIEGVHRAGLVGAGWSHERIEKAVRSAQESSDYHAALVMSLVNANLPYVLKNLEAWEQASS